MRSRGQKLLKSSILWTKKCTSETAKLSVFERKILLNFYITVSWKHQTTGRNAVPFRNIIWTSQPVSLKRSSKDQFDHLWFYLIGGEMGELLPSLSLVFPFSFFLHLFLVCLSFLQIK